MPIMRRNRVKLGRMRKAIRHTGSPIRPQCESADALFSLQFRRFCFSSVS